MLVEPLYGGNVGSVARAMANFGLERLILVRPAEGLLEDPQLLPMARENARHIIQSALVYDDLSQALVGVEIALGFSARFGKLRSDSVNLKDAVSKIAREHPTGSIAGVFGSEDKGLSNEDLEKCHWLTKIPTGPALSSLNLSQAVMLFAYEMFTVSAEAASAPERTRKTATVEEMEGFYGHLETVLDKIGFIEEENPARMMNAMRRIFSRRLPDPRDVRILRGMLSKVELALKRAENG